jgi:hypothetical protein
MKKANSVSDLSLYAALFLDIVAWDEDLRTSLTMDYLWLEKIVTTRGISFIMIDMPEGGKVIDQAISQGRLWSAMLPESFGKCRNHRREFLTGLIDRIFDDEGFLRKLVDPSAIRFLRQVLYLAKKVRKECSDAAVLAEVETFRKVDRTLRPFSLNWLSDKLEFPANRLSIHDDSGDTSGMFPEYRDHVPARLLSCIEKVADRVISTFPLLDWRCLEPKHGPGAVADGGRGVDKYHFPTWSPKLEDYFPFNYYGLSREDLTSADVPFPRPHEPPVRLLAVPKTLKGPRMIASEPASHQFIQLGLMEWFRQTLPEPLRVSIDFKDQEPSKALCLEASRTGKLATVDLTAASDRLSCWVVERLFRSQPEILRALHACRSRWLVNATKRGEPFFMVLKKYAPMGNGTTFPVQSMVYAIVAIACAIFDQNRKVTYRAIMEEARSIRVYGDDMIVPSSAVPSLVIALDYLGLKVNRVKTHTIGHFRESCGMDAFMGVDVTPLYLRDLSLGSTADSIVSWVDVTKNAARKGFPLLAEAMERQIPAELRSLLPRTTEDLGCLTLWSYFPGVVGGGKRRYNRRLHRHEVLGLVAMNMDVRRKRDTYGNLLQYFVEKPHPDTVWESGFVVRQRSLLRKRWVSLAPANERVVPTPLV